MPRRGTVTIRRALPSLQGRRLGAAALAFAALACGGPGNPSPPPSADLPLPPALAALELALPLEGQHLAGNAESYSLELVAGEYVEITLRADSADLALSLRGPDGARLLRLDTPSPEPVPERLVFLAELSGPYRLEVEGGREGAAGAFELLWAVKRRGSATDQQRAVAERSLALAEEQRRSSRKCSVRSPCESALPGYHESIASFRELEDAARERLALGQLVKVLLDLGRQVEAVSALERRLELLPPGDDEAERARTLQQLGPLQARLGRTREGELKSREALELWQALGNTERAADTKNDLARMALLSGRPGEAERLYLEVVAAWHQGGQSRNEAIGLANLSGVYLLTGKRDLALDFCERALRLVPDTGSPADRAFLLEQRGAALGGLGRTAEAERSYRQALELRAATAEPGAKAHALSGLARLAYDQKDWGRAAALYQDARRELQTQGNLASEVLVLQDLAWSEEKRGEIESARARFGEALALARQAELRWAEAVVLLGLAKLERNQGQLEEALAWAEQSIARLETLRSGAERLELRSAVGGDNQTFFDLAVDISLRLAERDGSVEAEARAFGWVDQARGRRLLDLLASKSFCGDAAAGERIDRAEEAVRALEAQGATAAAQEEARRELRAALAAQHQGSEPGGGLLDRNARPAGLGALRHLLAKSDAVLIAYSLGEERSVAWRVTATSLSSHSLPPTAKLEAEVRELHGLLSKSGWRADSVRSRELIARLGRELLPWSLEELAAARLLIVPDGALHYLPFQILTPRGGKAPLVASHEIAYAPSASTALRLASVPPRGQTPPFDVALVADPVFGIQDSRLSHLRGGAVPSPPPGRHEGAPLGELSRLLHAEREAQAIARRVAPGRLLLATGFEATKSRVLSDAVRSARVLHLAVHGRLDNEHPELSAVMLSPVDERGGPRDGTLYAYELPCHPLAAELVVLSACETGLGAELAGEGLVGLAHGFFGAGAGRVLATLWPVDDAATSVLMDHFYEGLLSQGLAPAAALRRAQERLRQTAGLESPFYWAGFVVAGGH